MSDATPRPPQVTFASWLIVLGSLGVLVTSWERISDLRSLDSREQVAGWVTSGAGRDLGLSTTELLDLLHWVTIAVAACAVAAAVLGLFLREPARLTRAVLGVLAVPIFLGGLVVGSILTSIVAAAVVMLWLPPGRWWFDPDKAPAGYDPKTGRMKPDERVDPGEGPRRPGPWTAAPYGSSPYGSLERRPQAVVTACLLTWALSAMVAVVLGLVIVTLLVSGSAEVDQALDEAITQMKSVDPSVATGLDRHLLLMVMIAMMAGFVLWSLLAVVLGVLVWQRRDWARWLLVVSAGCAALTMILGAVATPVLLVPFAGCVAVVILLLRRDVNAWLTRR
ncbi:hypothetical protein [Nocardioides sp. GY 10127]|uniref:hypothetical protein n=1 Tax=Nocardioides sp. GY 10127 TaxID=2569762 RepID=UPI0010A759F0|nr:hypothetical protein [Nocardioides sp. GY 10127]TIC80220.1 hypothetical protein E8D37_16715 [Nocardioides sp. GY 10127]